MTKFTNKISSHKNAETLHHVNFKIFFIDILIAFLSLSLVIHYIMSTPSFTIYTCLCYFGCTGDIEKYVNHLAVTYSWIYITMIFGCLVG